MGKEYRWVDEIGEGYKEAQNLNHKLTGHKDKSTAQRIVNNSVTSFYVDRL